MAKAHLESVAVTLPDGNILVCSVPCGELVEGLRLMSSPSVREMSFGIVDESGARGQVLLVKDSQSAIAVYATPMNLLHPREYYSNPETRARDAVRGDAVGFLESLSDEL